MNVLLNGKKLEVSGESMPLVNFLASQGVDTEVPGIAVAINYSVVPRSNWESTVVRPGDEIELITALQGG